MSFSEKVFFVGGTGNIGSKTVRYLLEKNTPVTLYARNPGMVKALFSKDNAWVNIVQGDFTDLNTLKSDIQGYSRLFLLVSDFDNLIRLKTEIAQTAYDADVQQIVDISSYANIFEIPDRTGRYVALRPARFMSNHHTIDHPDADGKIYDTAFPDTPQAWISVNDIAEITGTVLSDPIMRHADAVYTLQDYICTPKERAEILSRVTNREITYHQLTSAEQYKRIMKLGLFPHFIAYDLCTGAGDIDYIVPTVSTGIDILLGRAPETFANCLIPFKDQI